jgi:protein gp37
MSQRTPIEWCDSSANPVMGCDGCELWQAGANGRRSCYAGQLHEFRGGRPGYAKAFDVAERFPGRVAKAARWSDLTGTERPEKPWLNGLPRLIFLSDMGDALSKPISFEYLKKEIIDNVTSEHGRRHRWLWLTKQPRRMLEFSHWLEGFLGTFNGGEFSIKWPSNLWAGTSLTSTKGLNLLRIDSLLRIGDANTTRFLSIEPQVEPFSRLWLPEKSDGIHWVINGGESGKEARPFDLQWARWLRASCKDRGSAYFLKQLGANVIDEGVCRRFEDSHGGDWNEWPTDLRVREMPIKPEVRHEQH